MVQRRSTQIKYFLAVCFGVALFSEWFVYVTGPYYWPELRCHQDDSCMKILFIADPQIQGDYEFPVPVSYITKWDSDRYLRSSFSVVASHFRPDVLVFLGDLMDEGSVSTPQQYHQYVSRLLQIFEVDYTVGQVWIPGDNDIGGENEPVRKDKILEFNKVYQQPDIVSFAFNKEYQKPDTESFANISFYKVNDITHTYPKLRTEDGDPDTMRIVLSHYPITNKPVFGHQVNKEIHPHIYFCGHDHESKYVVQDGNLNHRVTNWLREGDRPLSINVSDGKMYEIYVPTCSYRMGVSSMGFGAAVIGSNKHMKYTVYWSPVRFPYLFVYLAILAIVVLYFCIFVMSRTYSCIVRSLPNNLSSSQQPLLKV